MTIVENGKKVASVSEKQYCAPAVNEIYVSPEGVKYRIGQTAVGKEPHWRTERMENGEWTPANSSFYAKFKNAQGEFGAWIRRESLVPEEADTQETLPASSEVAITAASGALTAESVESAPVPAFDYSGLDNKTIEYLHIAEREYAQGKVWAERGLRRMADGVAIAHEALATCATRCRIGETGRFGKQDTSFGAWCESIGISRKTAERLLQVSALYGKSSPDQQKVLEELSPSLLYAAARPSAPAELVEQVKSGDITTHKQYQALLAQLKARDDALKEKDAALQKKDAALKQAQELAEDRYRQAVSVEEDWKVEKTARQTLEALRDQLLTEQDEHLARIAELEARPIETTAVQPPSAEQLAAIRRQADEEARQKYYPLVEQAAAARKEVQAHADALAAQLRTLRQESRMPDMDTVYPMCRDYARSITTFQSTFLMVGAGLEQKEFEDCAHELMDAAGELRCILQAAIDSRTQTTQEEDDFFA